MISPIEIVPIYFLLPFIGFIGGLVGTIVGSGGGFFYLPVLVLLLGFSAQEAVIIALFASLPVCIIGSLGHYGQGHIDFKTGAKFALAGIVGAFVGAGLSNALSSTQLKASFGIYAIIVALNIAWGTFRKNQARANGTERKEISPSGKTLRSSFFGLAAGTISGAFGTSGAAPVLAGLLSLRMPLKIVVGTSLLVVLANTIFAIGAHLLIGKPDLTPVLFLTVGSIAGALPAAKLLSGINTDKIENKAKYFYAFVMVLIGIIMIATN